jgi:hypothetical protein
VDLDGRSVVFNGIRANFNRGVSSQDSVLYFSWELITDVNGRPVPEGSDGKGIKGPLRGYDLDGSIDRVNGIASISQGRATSEDDPNFRDTAATRFDLVCRPVKPLF